MSEPDAWLRPVTATDVPALWELLAVAVFADPPWTVNQVLAEPSIAHYLTGWPRPGDEGVVAVRGGDADGDWVGREAVVGAAWYRFLPIEDPGYGFVDASIPELTIACHDHWQVPVGQGRGHLLLQALRRRAKAAGVSSLSLSVDPENERAVRLYRRCGFEVWPPIWAGRW